MKSVAVFPETRTVGLVDLAPPGPPRETEVVLRTIEVGLCGTDREICAFEYGTPPPDCDFLVLGHESLAEVSEVGPGVTRCRPGDLVVPTVRRPCSRPDCAACRAHRQDFCVVGTVNAGIEAYEQAVRDLGTFLARWPDALRGLITTRDPVEAYRDVLLGEGGGIKRVITMAQS